MAFVVQNPELLIEDCGLRIVDCDLWCEVVGPLTPSYTIAVHHQTLSQDITIRFLSTSPYAFSVQHHTLLQYNTMLYFSTAPCVLSAQNATVHARSARCTKSSVTCTNKPVKSSDVVGVFARKFRVLFFARRGLSFQGTHSFGPKRCAVCAGHDPEKHVGKGALLM
eukprot:318283-Rhodomonas_salina.1